LRDLFEEPNSSTAASVTQIVIILCILLSCVTFCAETIPELEKHRELWYYTELVFVLIFTAELAIRATVTDKQQSEFWTDMMNLIDLMSLLPFYAAAIQLRIPHPESEDGAEPPDMRVLRIFRLMRVFKLTRHSSDLHFIFAGLAQAKVSFMLLGFLLMVALVFFSFLLFMTEAGEYDARLKCFVRKDEVHYSGCSPYQSVPLAFWWAITTLTTVGYGDTFPLSPLGRLCGGITMVCGLMCVALPTTQLGVEFGVLYNKGLMAKEQAKGRKAMMECSKEQLALIDQLKRLERLRFKLETQFPYVQQMCIVNGAENAEKTLSILIEQNDRAITNYKTFVLRRVSGGALSDVLPSVASG